MCWSEQTVVAAMYINRQWACAPLTFADWHRCFGTAIADLFASGETAHCPLCMGTDAMAHQWPQGVLYAFPPFILLHPLLQ